MPSTHVPLRQYAFRFVLADEAAALEVAHRALVEP
jgi:hypothetical protein